jgi:hypothetical protein
MIRPGLGRCALLAGLALAGCAGPPVDSSEQSPAAAEARNVLDALARGDLDVVTARFDASQRTPELPESLKQMASGFPRTPPRRVRLVRFNQQRVTEVGGSTTENTAATFEWNYAETSLLAQVVFVRIDGGELRLVGLHVNPLPAPLEAVNAFTLRGKGPVQILFLLAMAAVAAVTAVAIVVWAMRRRSLRRRWWWLLGICVGAFKISLSWTTGALAVQALTVQLFSLSCERLGVDGPWQLAFSIPAGAIAFLVVQRKAKADEARRSG